jgi:molybdate transport system ATP-binding protein
MTLDADIRLTQGAFTLDAQFHAPSGITALFGPSGGGKSSILAALAGLKPSQGYLRLDGRDISAVAPHRRGLGLVFQDARLFPHLSVRRNIAYAWARAPRRLVPALEDIARFFDIGALLDRPVRNLSGGEKSRVALARALASAPDFLLLDEPFAALDRRRRGTFLRVLGDTHRAYGISMLVVTHDIEEAAAIAGHLVAVAGGRIVAQGPFTQAVHQPAFRALLDPRDLGTAIPARLLHGTHQSFEQALWMRADHVMLAVELPRGISARNVLQGRVASLTAMGESRLVELQTDAGLVLSRLTPAAAKELALVPGKTVWALVKAHAF